MARAWRAWHAWHAWKVLEGAAAHLQVLLNATPIWGSDLPGWDGRLPAPPLPRAVGRALFDLARLQPDATRLQPACNPPATPRATPVTPRALPTHPTPLQPY